MGDSYATALKNVALVSCENIYNEDTERISLKVICRVVSSTSRYEKYANVLNVVTIPDYLEGRVNTLGIVFIRKGVED